MAPLTAPCWPGLTSSLASAYRGFPAVQQQRPAIHSNWSPSLPLVLCARAGYQDRGAVVQDI